MDILIRSWVAVLIEIAFTIRNPRSDTRADAVGQSLDGK